MDSKTLALITAITLALTGTLMTGNQSSEMSSFENFKSKYGKVYESEHESNYRFGVYTSNIEMINKHNSENHSYTMAENKFTDLTTDEFRAQYLMTVSPKKSNAPVFESSEEIVGDINWVTKGAVQRVKDQGQCGSCWAFSTVATTESFKFLSVGTLGDFAEQQLVDCDREDGNQGCSGGWPYHALDHLAAKGICTESSYPYTAQDGTCVESSCTKDSFTITGHNNIANNVNSVVAALNKQPVSVCVDATRWSSYSGGIFNDCTTSIDHAVLLVGFTSEYWLIKNSWGASWGESGYIRLTGNADTCGVLDYAVVPV